MGRAAHRNTGTKHRDRVGHGSRGIHAASARETVGRRRDRFLLHSLSVHRSFLALLLATGALTSVACGANGAGGDAASGSDGGGSTQGETGTPAAAEGGGAGGEAGAPGDDAAGASSGGPADTGAPPSGDAGVAACPMLVVDGGPASKWAHVDAPGHLAYATLPTGERLLDFSSAGYGGGGVAIPKVAVQQTVSPSGGSDDTAAIQAAIDAVSKLAPSGGIRGAVLLAAGTFQLQGSLSIAASGVVLRGSGSGPGGTVLQVGGSPRMVLTIAGTGKWTESAPTDVTDAYVPSGATTVHVASTTGLTPGTPVLLDRPVTAAWIQFMGMNDMVRDGSLETWIAAGSVIHADRTVVAVQGDAVTLDAPVSDTLDVSKWGAGAPHATLAAYTFPGRIEQVGVESLRLVAPEQTVPINQPIFGVLSMDAVKDAWISDVEGDEFTTGFVVGSTAKSVTVQDSRVVRVAPIDGSQGYPFHFSVDGQGVLVQRCRSSGVGVFSYATQATTPGPNVVLAMQAEDSDAGDHTNLQPHQRWATGLLVDDANTPTGGIGLMNRGWDGSGHGWAIGFGVVWNGVASSLLVQQPPGAQNWSIGATGKQTTASAPGSDAGPLPQGIVDSQGTPVAPRSLYLAQLCQRLGPAAVAATGN